jgi:hypothetical protein
MSVTHKSLVAMVFLLAVSACGKKQEAPATTVPEVAPVAAPVVATPTKTAPAAAVAKSPEAAPEIVVTALTLGSAVGTDKKISEAKTVFGLKDQIFVAVDTKNAAASAELVAKWTAADGQVINENTINFSPTDDASSIFKISNAKDWPEGKYKVDITLNGKPAQSAEFEVKK